jgi:hypothetical protein
VATRAVIAAKVLAGDERSILLLKGQIEAGYVGEVLSCHATTMRDGTLERPSSHT